MRWLPIGSFGHEPAGTGPGYSQPIDPDRFADLLCDWCLEVAPGDRVLVVGCTLAERHAVALHAEILDRDAWPFLWLSPPALAGEFYRHAQARHLEVSPPAELALAQGIDAVVRLDAPANTNELAGVNPALIARHATARSAVMEALRTKRGCSTLVPTAALAQLAGMSERDYAAFVTRAMFLDRPDPIAAWRELSATQAQLVERLTPARTIRIEADGTDLELEVTGRRWINSDGRRNMPSGEVFTGPLEASATGRIRFTVPTGPRGVAVTGVALEFRNGEVVSAHADQGQDYLTAALATDPGARRLGELGIGANPGIDRATGHILLDEKIAGTVHLALGRSYPETGASNHSALHWDLVCDLRDGGLCSADGVPVVQDGVVLGGAGAVSARVETNS